MKTVRQPADIRISKEGRWLILISLAVIAIILAIKLGVYSFLSQAPESLFARTEPLVKREIPDAVLTPEVEQSEEYIWQTLPPVAPAPADNPTTEAKVRLGEKLFYDKNLSADRTLACVSCHELYTYSGTDGSSVSTGIRGQKGDRNAPTVWNAAFQQKLFWDGRAASLEEQAVGPFINPIEMGMPSTEKVVERVRRQPEYAALFMAAFSGSAEISIERIAQAIASYERTLITADSPYDDFVRGDKTALTEQQLSGMALFEEAGCVHCHFGPNFSAASLFNSGIPFRAFPANPHPITEQFGLDTEDDVPGVWRVPSLRNVALTGPWFHNGAVHDLNEVVKIMAKTQLAKNRDRTFQWSDEKLEVIENPDLTDQQVKDIVAFLNALSSKKLTAAAELNISAPNAVAAK